MKDKLLLVGVVCLAFFLYKNKDTKSPVISPNNTPAPQPYIEPNKPKPKPNNPCPLPSP